MFDEYEEGIKKKIISTISSKEYKFYSQPFKGKSVLVSRCLTLAKLTPDFIVLDGMLDFLCNGILPFNKDLLNIVALRYNIESTGSYTLFTDEYSLPFEDAIKLYDSVFYKGISLVDAVDTINNLCIVEKGTLEYYEAIVSMYKSGKIEEESIEDLNLGD